MSNLNNIYLNKYYQVFDKNNSFITSGKCIGYKPNFKKDDVIYISFDNKWYYNSKSLNIKEVEYADTIILDEPPSSLIWDYWRNNKRGIEVDVYRDFSYDEIDPPIKPYIDKLNSLSKSFKTTESCCGHNMHNWQIGFAFYNIEILSLFLDLINDFENDLILVSNCNYDQNGYSALLRLCPNFDKNNYKKDYQMLLLDKFVRRLEKKIKLML